MPRLRWVLGAMWLVGCGDDGRAGGGGAGADPQGGAAEGGGGSANGGGGLSQGGAGESGGGGASQGGAGGSEIGGGGAGGGALRLGASCDDPAQCASGACADGVCCDAACDSGCDACTPDLTGAPAGSCAPMLSGALCRAANDVCDVEETCDGSSVDCPADAVALAGTSCRAGADLCDLEEYCDGLVTSCPLDAKEPTTTVCRSAAGPCDLEEYCSGGDACAPDELAAIGTPSTCSPYLCTGADVDCPSTCNSDASCASGLLCVDSACQAVKRVFVTSSEHTGNLGGQAGGDGICQTRAQAAGLPGSYKAWLTGSLGTPLTTFTQFQGPYVRIDGVKVADNFADLTDVTIDAPITVTDTGASLAAMGFVPVWTGTNSLGNAQGANCLNWTNATSSFTGWNGNALVSAFQWTSLNGRDCNQPARLYCFEQ